MPNAPLARCPRCDAFVPRGRASCVHCRSRVPAWLVKGAALLGGGALTVTLSACYGAPCAGGRCHEPAHPEPARCDGIDADGDGRCADTDCDDADPSVHECAGVLATDP